VTFHCGRFGTCGAFELGLELQVELHLLKPNDVRIVRDPRRVFAM
jgi:hypothetical protein